VTSFDETEGYTIGVEEEFQILDPKTGQLVSRIDEVLGKAGPDYQENIMSEIFQAVVETATDVAEDVDELREEITTLRQHLLDFMQDKGYTIAAAGTHPTAKWEDQDVTDKERYEDLVEEMRWAAKRELIFGQHVHVSVDNPPQAIFVNNCIRPFLPMILALSANSPFWQGRETGYRCSRVRIFDALPRTGVPRAFDDWADFEETLDKFKAAGSIEDITEIWWDVRPRGDLGTVELRIADLPTTIDESVALAAFTQALVARLCQAHDQGEAPPIDHDTEVIEENRWRALRDGLDAELIQRTESGDIEEVHVRDAIRSALDMLGDVPQELGVKDEMSTIETLLETGETGADRQLRIYEEEEDFLPVIRDLVERTKP
jgi:carboxylate-amine ligase